VHHFAKTNGNYSGNNPELCITFKPEHYQRFKNTTFRIETPESQKKSTHIKKTLSQP
jgi:hypothetical protein